MSSLKVLLADDVELFLELEKTFFRRAGVTLLVARTGQQAIDLVRAERPHLVFMDLYMPELDGDEACRRIKADPVLRFTPVVMVTHGGREEDLERCRQAGCDEVVLKPINRHQFLETARRFLDVVTRAAPRVGARLKVHYGLDRESPLSNFSINLSTGGLFLETDAPLAEDTPLFLEFDLPERPEGVSCRGRVAWVNDPGQPKNLSLPPGMGVQFVDLSLADMQLIRTFIKAQTLDPSW